MSYPGIVTHEVTKRGDYMSFLSLLFGSGAAAAGEAIAKPIDAIGNTLDKLFTSDDEKAAAEIVLTKLRMQPDILMAEWGKIEAASPSWWVSGWRPGIGWVCVVSLAAYYPPRFIAATVLWIMQISNTGVWSPPPEVGISDILALVGTLLGMAGLRTIEKKNGVAAVNMKGSA